MKAAETRIPEPNELTTSSYLGPLWEFSDMSAKHLVPYSGLYPSRPGVYGLCRYGYEYLLILVVIRNNCWFESVFIRSDQIGP